MDKEDNSYVYVCFDGDEDMNYYKTLKMWNANPNIDFEFSNSHTLTNIRVEEEDNIKRNLRLRMNKSNIMIVLIGEKTKNLYKYVRWEMELALNKDIPIIAVNINKKNGIDINLCPPIIRDKPVVHIPFKKDCINHALQYWTTYYPDAKKNKQTNLMWTHFDNMK